MGESHSELQSISNIQPQRATEGRPSTHIFIQNKQYTYNSLPSIVVEGKGTSKSKRKSVSKGVVSLKFNMNPNVTSRVLAQSELNPLTTPFYGDRDTASIQNLKCMRIENLDNIIIGHLNINSLRYKFHALVELIQGNLDILVVGETKLDSTFPEEQFKIRGYKKPYREDRNCNGGGVIIYVREDIPSQQLKKHNFLKNVEAIFVEINLRKNKFLLIGTYPFHKQRVWNDGFSVF